MSPRAVMDLRPLSPYTHGSNGPLWWGMVGLIAIETTVFASLISSYFYLRARATDWPPGAIEPPELLLPTIGTVVLLSSSIFVYWADSGIKEGKKRRLSIGMMIGAILALAFLAIKVVEYSDVEYRWSDNAYGSLVWTIVGFHSAHVMALVLKTLVVDVLAWRGYFTQERRIGVTINGFYWHFVVIVWIPLYLVLYWVPRWS